MSSVVQQSASRSLIAAACRGMGPWWAQHEKLHEEARTAKQAAAAAAPLFKICADCPIISDCDTWATLDNYTGIAAGEAWTNGRPRKKTGPPAEPRVSGAGAEAAGCS